MTGRSRWSTFTVIVLAVTAAGLLLLAWLALRGGVQAALAAPPAFWLFVVFLAVGQVRPIVLPKRGPAEEIATSTTFTLALLLGWGLGPAALALVAGSVTGDLVARKPPKKLLFNAAQLTLAMGAAGAVLRLLGGRPPFSTGQLPAFALAAAVYFVVNKTLVRVVVALARSASVWHTLWESRVVVLPEAILVAMAPVAVVLAQRSVLLVLLLPLPMIGVHLAYRAAIEAEANRATAEAAVVAARVVAAEQARLAQAEQAVARRLQESERLKANLLATVSHELRTPLAGVLGAIATLEQRGHLLTPELRSEFVAMAARQGKRLRELIEDLLLAATLEQIPSERLPSLPVDASGLARQACEAVRLSDPRQAVTVSLNGALPVRAAPEAVLQVLTNLLDNAAKYSPEGACVRLEARGEGDYAVIAVEDAGPGVPTAERERIFERFIRLDEAGAGGTRRSGGVGLGLYVARQLARAQGGDLRVEEPVGAAGGARFELRLPLVAEVSELGRTAPASGGS